MIDRGWLGWLGAMVALVPLLALGADAKKPGEVGLTEPGWRPSARAALEAAIKAGAGQGNVVVFDFDNTIIYRDCGEATFAVLVKNRVIDRAKVPAELAIPFRPAPGKPLVDLESVADLTEYYEAFLHATDHAGRDPSPYVNAYAWLVQLMAGLSPADVVVATAMGYQEGAAEKDLGQSASETAIEVTPGKTSYRVPFFYPQMVELCGQFLKNGYEVWVVSASNVWTVRWMVLNGLNPLLEKRGFPALAPARVIGVSTLLVKTDDQTLHKDRELVLENPAYARMDPAELKKYRLTSQIVYPMPGFGGKVANVIEHVGKPVYFAAGDSPNDFALLGAAQRKLWIARLEKPDYQAEVAALIAKDGAGWMLQPTLSKTAPGFIGAATELSARGKDADAPIKEAIATLTKAGLLDGF